MSKISKLVAKIKQVKNIELYLALVLIVIVCITFFVSNNSQKTTQTTLDNQSYIQEMESKIITVLKDIDGCGDATVAISYATDGEKVFAEEKTTTQIGDRVETETSIVLVKGQPLVVSTLAPKITGVVVVASGAKDVKVKYQIIQVVVTLLDVDASNVQVFTHKS